MVAHRRESLKRESERRFAREERERDRRARSSEKRERRQTRRHGAGLDALIEESNRALG